MQIRLYKDTDKEKWDSYVFSHPDSTHCHLSGWKNVIEKTYGHKGYYLIAEEDSGIRGVLPLKKDKFYLRLLSPFLTIFQKFIEIVTGISIPFNSKIGRGLYIGHFGGIVLGTEVIIGEYCNLSQQVTIGQGGRGGIQKSPTIRNFVYIGPGAKIFGGITIGNHVAIGANAVVTEDVPDHAVIAGVPAKIINFNGSSDFIRVRS